MFETGVRQFRMAMGMVWGRRFKPHVIARLVDDALATLAEFGEPGADVRQLIEGPLNDREARRHMATQGVRRTATRLAELSPFYARRLEGIKTGELDAEDLGGIPVTVKADLVARPAEFLCKGVTPHLSTRTTGTTGKPAEIWLSRYEMELWPAMGALSAVLSDQLRPGDVMQVNLSSRATAAVHLDVAGCRLARAGCRVLGVVPVDEALDALTDRVTLWTASPSYLAEMVVAARRRGMGPGDFRLRTVFSGGEVLSASVAAALRETFGVSDIHDNYGLTEAIPVTARTCSQGHLHHDIITGLVEYLDLETGEPAGPGALATLVVTPFFPYRDCMPVFRYDTRDLVRTLPDQELSCERAGLPATSPILGKADRLLRAGGAVVTPRELVEAIEALPTRPWPARFRAEQTEEGIRITLPESAVAGFGVEATKRQLNADIVVVPDEEAATLRQLRSDLHETTFAGAGV